MPNYQQGVSRSNYFSVTGIVDVIGSVQLQSAPAGNLLLHALEQDERVARTIRTLGTTGYEVIIDYKGMRRPGTTTPTWQHHQWQIMTYAWLRNNQPHTQPIAAGILLYLNELYPSQEDMRALREELRNDATDILPTGDDATSLQRWRPRTAPPALSQILRETRSLRIVPIDTTAITSSLGQFDNVVQDIETAVLTETGGRTIKSCWTATPETRTCTACDFKTFCPKAAPTRYHPTVP